MSAAVQRRRDSACFPFSFVSMPFMRFRRLVHALSVLPVAVSLAASPPAQAQAADAATTREQDIHQQALLEIAFARKLLAERQPDMACRLLKGSLPDAGTEAERVRLLARCSSALHERGAAEDYYRRAIALTPDDPAIKVELAGLYLAMGRSQDSSAMLSAAAGQSAGSERDQLEAAAAQLRANDPAALAANAANKGKPWSLQVYMGLTWDDNINAGPVSRSVPAVIGGIPVTFDLVEDAMPHKSAGAAMGINASYGIPLDGRFSLLFQGAWFGTGYVERQDYNNDTTTLAAALVYTDKTWAASIQPNVRYTRLDGHLQESTPGVTGRVARSVTDAVSLTATGGYARRTVHTDANRNADAWQGGLGALAQLTPQWQVGGEYLWQREQADAAVYSRRLSGPSAYLQYRINPDLLLGANLSYTDVRYDQAMALFAEPRIDRQKVVSLSALWDVSRYVGRNMVVRAQYTNIDNPSNIAYSDFRRNMFNLGVQMQF